MKELRRCLLSSHRRAVGPDLHKSGSRSPSYTEGGVSEAAQLESVASRAQCLPVSIRLLDSGFRQDQGVRNRSRGGVGALGNLDKLWNRRPLNERRVIGRRTFKLLCLNRTSEFGLLTSS
jgi:hypothetical protein